MRPAVIQALLAASNTREEIRVAAAAAPPSAASAFPYEATIFKTATSEPRKETKGICPQNTFPLKIYKLSCRFSSPIEKFRSGHSCFTASYFPVKRTAVLVIFKESLLTHFLKRRNQTGKFLLEYW